MATAEEQYKKLCRLFREGKINQRDFKKYQQKLEGPVAKERAARMNVTVAPSKDDGWGGDPAITKQRRIDHIHNGLSRGWCKQLTGRDIVVIDKYTFEYEWDENIFKGLYLGEIDSTGRVTLYRRIDEDHREVVRKVNLTDDELKILALLMMREFPEAIW